MNDMDRIQGTWALISGERHGDQFTDGIVKNVKLTFFGATLKTHKQNDVTEATFTLHPETNPKGIDLNMDGSLGLGIYTLDGNTLTILHGEVEEPDQPPIPITLTPRAGDTNTFETAFTVTHSGVHSVRVWTGNEDLKQVVRAATLQFPVELPNLEVCPATYAILPPSTVGIT